MRPNYPETLAAMGFYYREKGNIERAIALFEKPYRSIRRTGRPQLYGVTLFRMGDTTRPCSIFKRPSRSIPERPVAHQRRALEFSRGNLEAAKKYFEEAIDSTPRYAQPNSTWP